MARRTRGLRHRTKTAPIAQPQELRETLVTHRLRLRALFRALDLVGLAQKIPKELHALFELDADLVEALWVLDQPPGQFNMEAMARDTMDSLAMIAKARNAFFALLSTPQQTRLISVMNEVHASLTASDAYLQIPGRDPFAC